MTSRAYYHQCKQNKKFILSHHLVLSGPFSISNWCCNFPSLPANCPLVSRKWWGKVRASTCSYHYFLLSSLCLHPLVSLPPPFSSPALLDALCGPFLQMAYPSHHCSTSLYKPHFIGSITTTELLSGSGYLMLTWRKSPIFQNLWVVVRLSCLLP